MSERKSIYHPITNFKVVLSKTSSNSLGYKIQKHWLFFWRVGTDIAQ